MLTDASASCFFLAMFEAAPSRCFSRSLLNSKINEAIKQPPKVPITCLMCLPTITQVLQQQVSAKFVLLFLLRSHVGLNNEPLDGEVEDQRSNCSVKYGARQELVSEVNREEVRLAGSVQPANTVGFIAEIGEDSKEDLYSILKIIMYRITASVSNGVSFPLVL